MGGLASSCRRKGDQHHLGRAAGHVRRVELATASATDMAQCLENFASIVEQWRQKLGSDELVAGSGDTAAPEPRLGMYLRG